ncbi:hypothetical protein [Caproicibacterium sp. XB2]|uniref:hypothetical protein n=1 Tax=Caproicibacterium sp. XB2 TaxID=3388458 RepID=UPI00384DB915
MKFYNNDWDWATRQVAPYTGAWIEIDRNSDAKLFKQSLPTRERGLKYNEHIAL